MTDLGSLLFDETSLIVVVPLQKFRARQEEQVLEQRFGEQYRIYKRNTWF